MNNWRSLSPTLSRSRERGGYFPHNLVGKAGGDQHLFSLDYRGKAGSVQHLPSPSLGAPKAGNPLSNKLDVDLTQGQGEREKVRARKNVQGFSLISAIFLLVVIAALGVFAVTLSTTQQQSTALDVMGVRAYQAAKSGIEWGAYQVTRNAGACAPSTTLLVAVGTLSAFTIIVECTVAPFDEAGRTVAGGNPVRVYNLISTAKQGAAGAPNYVERQMSVTIAL